jgi:hypothetical protein
MLPEADPHHQSARAPVPAWTRWLLVAWALLSLIALVWLDWNAALRGVLCLPRG